MIDTIRQKLPMFFIKSLVLLLLLGPLIALANDLYVFRLGANPVEEMLHRTGTWSIRILLLALAVSPLQMVFRSAWPVRFRRMIGVTAFFYVLIHLLIYLWLDRQWYWDDIVLDIIDRPYITVGFAAFCILLALALTSFKRMMRYMGRKWKTLHRGAYIAGLLGVLHYLWLVKADLLQPLIYGGVLIILMAFRYKPARILLLSWQKPVVAKKTAPRA